MARVKVKCPKCNYSFYGPEQSKQNIAALKGTAKVIGNITCRAATIAGGIAAMPFNHYVGHAIVHGSGEIANGIFGKIGDAKFGAECKCPKCGSKFVI